MDKVEAIIYFPFRKLYWQSDWAVDALQISAIFAILEGCVGSVIGRFYGGFVYGSIQLIKGDMWAAGIDMLIFALMGLAVDYAHPYHSGMAVIKHLALGFLLWCNDKLVPIRFDKFLDYCSEMILMQKVGSGYMFIHRLLLEHFAQMHPYQAKHPQDHKK